MGADKLFPIFVAAVCIVMLVRLALGEQRRARMDRVFLGYWLSLTQGWQQLRHWRKRRQSAEQARKAAQEVINRVRHRVEREGNVLTPEAFKSGSGSGSGSGPRKPH